MLNHTLSDLVVSGYGANISVGDNVAIAEKGATARTMTFPPEGMTFTANLKLLTGYTALSNSTTQVLNMSRLEVDENSGSSVVLNVRPTSAQMLRDDQATSPTLEALSVLDINATDRSQYVFTSTTLGNRPLRIAGRVKAHVTDAQVVVGSTAVPTGSFESPITSGTPTPPVPQVMGTDVDGSVYGYWDVQTTIQALTTEYSTFTLKAGSTGLSDTTLVSATTGLPVLISEMNLLDGNGKFLADFTLNPTVYSIIESFTSNDVLFAAGSVIPEGTTVGLSTYVNGTTSLNTPGTYFLYAYGTAPKYQFKLSRGSVVENTFSVLDGFVLPGGQVIPPGSTTSDGGNETDYDLLTLPNVVGSEGFQLLNGSQLTGVIPSDDYITLPAGMTSTLLQPVNAGMKTDSNLALQDMFILPESSLESEVTLLGSYGIIQPILLAYGSILKAGTMLYRGSASIAGSLITGMQVITAGTTLTSRIDLSSHFVVNASSTIFAGTVLKGPFSFPVGTQFTSGNSVPSVLKIVTSMGATLAKNMILLAGSAFGSNGTVYNNVGFSPTSIIPALSTLSGTWTFPAGTKLFSNLVSGFSIPIPNGFVFAAGSTIPAGTSFKEGSSHIPVPDLTTQASAPFGGSDTSVASGPLSRTVDGEYIIVKAHTTFLPGFKFPTGTVLSLVATPGHTNSLESAQDGTPTLIASGTQAGADVATVTSYKLTASSYSLDETINAPGQDAFTFNCGVPTQSLVVMLADTTLPYDVLLPVGDLDAGLIQYLSFNDPLVLINDIVLTAPYTVNGNGNVTWPSGVALPSDFVLTSSFTQTFSPPVTISKPIQFNVPTSAPFITGVMSTGAYLRYPPAGYTLSHPIQLAEDQEVAATGDYPTKAFVTLSQGTILLLAGSPNFVTLGIKMASTGNYTVTTDLPNIPRFELPNGIILLAGNETPGDIVLGNGTPTPSDLPLPVDTTLASDLTITNEDGYLLTPHSEVAASSVLARETYFPLGADLSNVIVSPILSMSDGNVFLLNEGEPLTSTIQTPYIFNTETQSVHTLRVDARALLGQIATLVSQVAALQAAMA